MEAKIVLEEEQNGLTFQLASLYDADKKTIQGISKQIEQRVKDGELDSVKAFIHARKGTELFKDLEERLRPHMESDATVPAGEEGLTMFNCHLQRADTGVKYDYAHCNDAIWNKLDADIKVLSEAKKEREAYLKSIKAKTDELDEETGEAWSINPPIRTGRSGIKVSLK